MYYYELKPYWIMDSLETEDLLLQLVQTYIKEVYVACFGAGYYKYKDLTIKTDIIQDLVSTK